MKRSPDELHISVSPPRNARCWEFKTWWSAEQIFSLYLRKGPFPIELERDKIAGEKKESTRRKKREKRTWKIPRLPSPARKRLKAFANLSCVVGGACQPVCCSWINVVFRTQSRNLNSHQTRFCTLPISGQGNLGNIDETPVSFPSIDFCSLFNWGRTLGLPNTLLDYLIDTCIGLKLLTLPSTHTPLSRVRVLFPFLFFSLCQPWHKYPLSLTSSLPHSLPKTFIIFRLFSRGVDLPFSREQ